MPEIAINFDRDIWSELPSRTRALGKESYRYRFHHQVFTTLFTNKALPEINFLKDQIFLDTAQGSFLDLKGDEYGIKRLVGEDDETYREKIRFLRILKVYGLSRYAIGLYVLFRTGYGADIQDEYDFTGRIETPNSLRLPGRFLVITTPKGRYSRAYIRFWNVPPLNTSFLYSALRELTEPYNKIILTPYTGIEAVKKIMDYYSDNYTLTEARKLKVQYPVLKDSGVIINSTATWNLNPLGIKLHSNPRIPVEKLKEELEARAKGYSYYLKFTNLTALLENYISGGFTDITTVMKSNSTYIWPKGFDSVFLDVIGDIRIDPPKLVQKIAREFGVKAYIRDPLFKRLKELMPGGFKIIYGCEIGFRIRPKGNFFYDIVKMDGYMVSPETAQNAVYIFYDGNIDVNYVTQELLKVKNKDFRLRRT